MFSQMVPIDLKGNRFFSPKSERIAVVQGHDVTPMWSITRGAEHSGQMAQCGQC